MPGRSVAKNGAGEILLFITRMMHYAGAVKMIRIAIVWVALWAMAWAGQTLDVVAPSAAMRKEVHNLIMLPDAYDGERRFPVIYLLHGHDMKYTDWLRVQRDLPRLADLYGVILVCPDAANSWYWDSPVNPAMRYETYVAGELPEFIKTHYKTIDARWARAVTGLSMGGHGALWLAIRHQDVYGACGSMSGAVDIRPYPNKWNIEDSLGKYEDNPQRWAEHTVMTLLDKIVPGPLTMKSLPMIIDCGRDDIFCEINENLHRELLRRKIPHDYISRPGIHNGRYWRNAVLYQLLFFSEHFKRAQAKEDALPSAVIE